MFRKLTIATVMVLSFTLLFALVYPFTFISVINGLSPYKTQTVVYRNIDNPEIRIEFQMKNIGAMGYERRVVQVTPGILWDDIKAVDESLLDRSRWRRVDEEINELGLKS